MDRLRLWGLVFMLVLYAVSAGGLFWYGVDEHEQAHEAVCRYWGGNATRLDFNHVNCSVAFEKQIFLDGLNEVVGYNNQLVYGVFFLSTLCVLAVLVILFA